jgi:hypothetical protein
MSKVARKNAFAASTTPETRNPFSPRFRAFFNLLNSSVSDRNLKLMALLYLNYL